MFTDLAEHRRHGQELGAKRHAAASNKSIQEIGGLNISLFNRADQVVAHTLGIRVHDLKVP